MGESKVDLWRRRRKQRRARARAAELRRKKPIEVRPGGNEYQQDHAKYAGLHPVAAPIGPIAKHVTQNTHRVGSIAYAFFYGYWLPNSAHSK